MELATAMLVTDVEDERCWRHFWSFSSQTFKTSRQYQNSVTNIKSLTSMKPLKLSSFPIMAFVYVADQEYISGCLDSDGADAFLYEKIRSSFFVDVQGIILNLPIVHRLSAIVLDKIEMK